MATSSHLRQINQRAILVALMRHRRASRVELSKLTGVSQPTVGRIVDQLLSDCIVAEIADESSAKSEAASQRAGVNGFSSAAVSSAKPQLGRPSQLLELDRKRKRFLAMHLGVNRTRMAWLPFSLPETDRWEINIPTPDSADEWVTAVCMETKKRGKSQGVEAVLVCVPGVLDEQRGQILMSPNRRWLEHVPLRPLLQRANLLPQPNSPLLIIHEVRALAMGQLALEPGATDFLLVYFGDGVGAAAVIGGNLYSGALPLSGELGHTPVLGNKRPCGCGATGCIETLLSRRGLLQSAAEAAGTPVSWEEMVETIKQTGISGWLAEALDAMAVTIVGALNVLGLPRVVITGMIMDFPQFALDYLFHGIRRGAMWARFGEVLCTTVPRHRTAGMLSAAINRFPLTDCIDGDQASANPSL